MAFIDDGVDSLVELIKIQCECRRAGTADLAASAGPCGLRRTVTLAPNRLIPTVMTPDRRGPIGAAFQFGPSSGAPYLLNSLAIVVLGGLGNVLGTLVGGLVLGFLQSLGGLTLGDGYRDVVGMALFLLVLAFRPAGFLARGRS